MTTPRLPETDLALSDTEFLRGLAERDVRAAIRNMADFCDETQVRSLVAEIIAEEFEDANG